MVENTYSLNAIHYTVQEEINKIERDIQELKRLNQDYKAPTNKAEKYLEKLLIEKYDYINQIGMQLKVFQIQFQDTQKLVNKFNQEGHKICVQNYRHPDIIVSSVVLAEFRK
ncbi:Conserved_hypothetical protein [Hexamita inflata]|uniref:Uncharacterized protein n=1 Tax=Hexamita inflata TaxID=28002 RepID=A0AA86NZL9_9EUKA|nr:Conserved hypothetical protein [Hexamita inflata]